MAFFTEIIQTLAALALLATGVAVALCCAQVVPRWRRRLRELLDGREFDLIALAWVVALMATLGSLYLSDVVGFTPCKLCWYQRILMYPLVLVLGAGLALKDPGVWRFALPLPLLGVAISGYHVALQYRPSLEVLACDVGGSCSNRYLSIFGFVSIPVMATAAFLLIAALLFTVRTIQVSPR